MSKRMYCVIVETGLADADADEAMSDAVRREFSESVIISTHGDGWGMRTNRPAPEPNPWDMP